MGGVPARTTRGGDTIECIVRPLNHGPERGGPEDTANDVVEVHQVGEDTRRSDFVDGAETANRASGSRRAIVVAVIGQQEGALRIGAEHRTGCAGENRGLGHHASRSDVENLTDIGGTAASVCGSPILAV